MRSNPLRWRSIFREPMLHPPGMATRARPKRASSGPRTTIDARIRRTSSYGVSSPFAPEVSIRRVDPSHVRCAPRCSSTSPIVWQSAMRGTFSMTVSPSARSDAAISFSAEFFAPLT